MQIAVGEVEVDGAGHKGCTLYDGLAGEKQCVWRRLCFHILGVCPWHSMRELQWLLTTIRMVIHAVAVMATAAAQVNTLPQGVVPLVPLTPPHPQPPRLAEPS